MKVFNRRRQGKALFAAGREVISKTLSYYASFVVLGLALSVIGPTLPGLAEQTSVRLSEISFLFVGNSFGYLIGSLLGGRFYDRTSGHPLMAGALFVLLAMLALVPIIPFLWIMMMVVLFNVHQGLAAADTVFDHIGAVDLIVGQSQFGQLFPQMVQGKAGVQKGSQDHVSAGP